MLDFLENISTAEATERVGVLESREASAFQLNTVVMLEMHYMKWFLPLTSVITSFSGCYQSLWEP